MDQISNKKKSRIEVQRALVQVWRRLGPSWAIQSVFGGILDRLGGVLEASWRGLGGLLGGLGPRMVANMAATKIFNTSHGLFSDTVFSMAIQDNGTYWIGSFGGVAKIKELN